MSTSSSTRYARIIEHIFEERYEEGLKEVAFERSALVSTAEELGIKLPKNLGDVIYSFKFRTPLPQSIQARAPEGKEWVIVSRGRAKYAFVAKEIVRIVPDSLLVITKIPDATPGLVAMYALDDEQALLTKLRYNRMLDIFTGIACYSLQNHLRTTVPGIGQIETDELYVGVDKRGVHYVLPVQAKGGNDELGIVQVEQDIALCQHRFPSLMCRAIAAQFMAHGVIALFEFGLEDGEVRKVAEKHYKLVPSEEISEKDLAKYRERAEVGVFQ